MKRPCFLLSAALLILLINISVYSSCYAIQRYYYQSFSLKDGLSNSNVMCILHDSRGNIWTGGRSGLNRTDGYETHSYNTSSQDRSSLPGHQIFYIFEDARESIWVASEKGLAQYDHNSDSFKYIEPDGTKLISYSYLMFPDGFIFNAHNRLYKYSYEDGSVTLMPRSYDDNSSYTIRGIHYYEQGTLLLRSREAGFSYYDTGSGKMTRAKLYPEVNVNVSLLDSSGRLWLSSYGSGLKCYERNGKLNMHLRSTNSNIGSDIIMDIVEHKGKIWVATDGGGICIVDPESGSTTLLEHIPGDDSSLPVNSFNSLCPDRNGDMMAGSVRNGLILISETFMKTYRDVSLESSVGLSDKTVISLFEDNKGIVWIGTDGGGINRLDPSDMKFRHYPRTYGMKVTSIGQYDRNELIISCYDDGVYLFNTDTGTLRRFIIVDEATDRAFNSQRTVAILQLNEQKYAFLSPKSYIYDAKNNSFSPLALSSDVRQAGPLLFISGNGNKSYLCDYASIYELGHDTEKLKALYSGEVYSIDAVSQDADGVFWIGGRDGLARYDPVSNEYTLIETFFGAISALKCDPSGSIWIGAQGSLFLFRPHDGSFILFNENDGVLPNEYLASSVLTTRKEDIFFGGVNGLLRIDNEFSLRNYAAPVISLKGFYVNGAAAASDRNIKIAYNYNSISLKVHINQDNIFQRRIFRYTINGPSRHMVDMQSNVLNIPKLLPGSYSVMASCSIGNGEWSEEKEILNFVITPPWWRQAWFTIVLIFGILGSISGVYLYIRRRHRNQIKWTIKEQEKKMYEDKVRFLINVSHELRTPLTLVYAPLKKLMISDSLTEDVKKTLKAIFRQARNMKEIIDMVLEARKIEVSEESLKLGRYPFNQWVKESADEFSTEFSEKNIAVNFIPDENIGEIVFDRKKCTAVLSNILSNALKYSDRDSSVTISTALADGGRNVRVEISDQGIGLGNIEPGKLFSRFSQGNHDRPGTGVGLSYAKMLVEMHNGTIGAFNNSERGATFFFNIPTNLEQEANRNRKAFINELFNAPPEEEETFRSEITASPGDRSILLAEDEPELLAFLKESMSVYYKNIYTAKDGAEALIMAKQHRPDVIISDVMMPRMNGYELCRNIRADKSIGHTPIILLTARSDRDSQMKGYSTGANSYLSKPFDMETLLAVTATQLSNREMIKELYLNHTIAIPLEKNLNNSEEIFMNSVHMIMSENLNNPSLDVDFIIGRINMSRSAFYQRFKRLTDMGVKEYINRYKLETAKHLLANSDKTVYEVTEITGFSNQSYFSSVFKNHTGMTPSQYRSGNNKEDA